ncbi:hypothetical protein [Emticicia soli]|uniref:Pentapeptide repeat-containing protein n=1 Tax=Emticicia soli TaxID=2027878 RepID=A0ABW5JAV5_9BACT
MSNENRKHKISEEEFISALKLNEQEFNLRKKEFKEKGVERIVDTNLGEYTKSIPNFNFYNYNWPNTSFIVFNDIEVFTENDIITILNPDMNSNCNIIFINCHLPKISISNTIRNEIRFNSILVFNTKIKEIIISNFNIVEFNLHGSECDHLCIQERSTIKNLSCHNSSKIPSLRILGASAKDISFGNSEVNIFCGGGRIGQIHAFASKLGLNFDQSILRDIDLRGCEVGSIFIQELVVIKSITFWNSTLKDFLYYGENIGDLKIINSKIGKITYSVSSRSNELEINDSNIEQIIIYGTTFNKISINKSNFQEILFSNCSFINSYFYFLKCNNINFENCNFYELKVSSNINKDSFLIFSKSFFFSLNISYFSSVLGFIFFKEMKPIHLIDLSLLKKNIPNPLLENNYNDSLVEKDFLFERKDNEFKSNYSEWICTKKNTLVDELLKKYQQPTFVLCQSTLGKAEFTDCDLNSFDFQFSNSKITEIFISGGTIPSNNIQIFNIPKDTLEWHEQKVSIYNQLKKVFDSQGDVFWSSHFQSKTSKHQSRVLELRVEKESKNSNSWTDKVNQFFSSNRFDLRAFKLNQFSNLHGENWGRALAFTLFVPIPFYCLYLWSVGRLFVFSNEIDWNLIGYYFSFLDPTHKIDFLEDAKGDLNGWSRFLDFASRIVVSYGIYQLIVAFRKLGKKA